MSDETPRIGPSSLCLGGTCDRCDRATAGGGHVLVFTGDFGHMAAHLCPACGEVDIALEALAR